MVFNYEVIHFEFHVSVINHYLVTVITVVLSPFLVTIMVMKLHGTLMTKILNQFGDLMR